THGISVGCSHSGDRLAAVRVAAANHPEVARTAKPGAPEHVAVAGACAEAAPAVAATIAPGIRGHGALFWIDAVIAVFTPVATTACLRTARCKALCLGRPSRSQESGERGDRGDDE